MKTITIDRKTWLRGEGSEESRLLRHDGQRCCIGFVCQQLGSVDDCLMGSHGVRNLANAPKELKRDPDRIGSEAVWLHEAYRVNDDLSLTDAARESQLIALAAANGFEFKFVD